MCWVIGHFLEIRLIRSIRSIYGATSWNTLVVDWMNLGAFRMKSVRGLKITAGLVRLLSHKSLLLVNVPAGVSCPALATTLPAIQIGLSVQSALPCIWKSLSAENMPCRSQVGITEPAQESAVWLTLLSTTISFLAYTERVEPTGVTNFVLMVSVPSIRITKFFPDGTVYVPESDESVVSPLALYAPLGSVDGSSQLLSPPLPQTEARSRSVMPLFLAVVI